jgi:hypothetical protein
MDDEAEELSISASGSGKRKRTPSQSVTNNPRLIASYPGNTQSVLSSTSKLKSRVILKSAFRPPGPPQPKWTRDPQMIQFSFIRSTASVNQDGDVKFVTQAGMECDNIEIAKDWVKGQKLYDEGKPHEATGFIGKGYTKRGIYVSCLELTKQRCPT